MLNFFRMRLNETEANLIKRCLKEGANGKLKALMILDRNQGPRHNENQPTTTTTTGLESNPLGKYACRVEMPLRVCLPHATGSNRLLEDVRRRRQFKSSIRALQEPNTTSWNISLTLICLHLTQQHFLPCISNAFL
jgi:hypothetical protein